jgi:hypothetical protein
VYVSGVGVWVYECVHVYGCMGVSVSVSVMVQVRVWVCACVTLSVWVRVCGVVP